MQRRNLIRSALAFTLGAPTAIGAISVYDPLLMAIREYRDGIQAFNQCDDGHENEFSHLWRAPFDRIKLMEQPAASREGALEALRLAMEEDEVGDSQIIQPLIRAALGYFETA